MSDAGDVDGTSGMGGASGMNDTGGGGRQRIGEVLEELFALLESRREEMPEGSYTAELLGGPQEKLLKKIAEESGEVIIAARDHDPLQTTYEAADLVYHLLVVLVREGIALEDLAEELDRRRG